MEVEYGKYYYTGWPKDVLTGLKISIALYLRSYRNVKIGITNWPERRFYEHIQRDSSIKWQRMVVKYQTTSVANANKIEKYFIDNETRLRNRWNGFSKMSESGPYYVYILLSGKRTK